MLHWMLWKNNKNQISAISLLSDVQINKIDLYTYDISGVPQRFCKVDQIEKLIKDEIKEVSII